MPASFGPRSVVGKPRCGCELGGQIFDPLPKGPCYRFWVRGRLVKLPDDTTTGLRPTSKSGGPTIDVKYPDGTLKRVHVDQ